MTNFGFNTGWSGAAQSNSQTFYMVLFTVLMTIAGTPATRTTARSSVAGRPTTAPGLPPTATMVSVNSYSSHLGMSQHHRPWVSTHYYCHMAHAGLVTNLGGGSSPPILIGFICGLWRRLDQAGRRGYLHLSPFPCSYCSVLCIEFSDRRRRRGSLSPRSEVRVDGRVRTVGIARGTSASLEG